MNIQNELLKSQIGFAYNCELVNYIKAIRKNEHMKLRILKLIRPRCHCVRFLFVCVDAEALNDDSLSIWWFGCITWRKRCVTKFKKKNQFYFYLICFLSSRFNSFALRHSR